MAKRDPVQIKTPVCRIVWGSVSKLQTMKDSNGQPKLIKNGDRTGQVLQMVQFGVAVPKTKGHWAEEPGWGAAVWAEGHSSWPGGQAQRADFAWKVVDGDSTVPNKAGKRPCDQTGYPGHWILSFSGMTPPTLVQILTPGAKPTPVEQPETIYAGCFVEVAGSVSSNESTQTAGMYLNHAAVCLRGFGERIAQGIDVDAVGFGADALPPGASAMPVGTALPPPAPA
ncbi:MAG: DUF2815 family protein, partial [Haliea sp.]